MTEMAKPSNQALILRVPQAGDSSTSRSVAARNRALPRRRSAACGRMGVLQMPGAWVVQGFGMFSVVAESCGR